MTPDRAAIDAVRDALERVQCWDSEQMATIAVTTLQGLGWRPPPIRSQAWDTWAAALNTALETT